MTDDPLAAWSAAMAPLDERVCELFHTYRDFAWAATLPYRPTDAESLRKHVVS